MRAIRARWLLIAGLTLATLAGGLAFVSLKSPEYRATAEILVSPLPPDDRTFLGLGVVPNSGLPVRTVQTAASLLETDQAAEIAARRIGRDWTRRKVLDAVSIAPKGESNVLGVSATAEDEALAARLANEFARASLSTRWAALEEQIEARIDRLRARAQSSNTRNGTATGLEDRLEELEAVRDSGKDPTLSLSRPAVPPTSQAGAPPWLIVGLSVLAGLALGLVAVFLLELFNRRIGDEEELSRLYPLPVLARVPPLSRRLRRRGPVRPSSMPSAGRDAFRTLRAQLEQPRKSPLTVMFTSACAGDGKTTAAAGLALSAAAAGRSVILIDFDLRSPQLGRLLGVEPLPDLAPLAKLASVTNPGDMLSHLLVESPQVPGVSVIPATKDDLESLEALSETLPDILAQARARADLVIIDAAPLGEVSDALNIVPLVDQVVLVTRPRHTKRTNLGLVRDLLERTGAKPAGILITGQKPPSSSSRYTAGADSPDRASKALALLVGLWVSTMFFPALPIINAVENAGFVLVPLVWLGLLSKQGSTPFHTLRRNWHWLVILVPLSIWMALSIGWAQSPTIAGEGVRDWYIAAIAFPIVATTIATAHHLRLILYGLVIGAAVSVIAGLADPSLTVPVDTERLRSEATGAQPDLRLSGGEGDPNTLAAGLVPAIVLAAGLLSGTRSWGLQRVLITATVLLLAVGLAATASRGGYLAAAAATVVALIVFKQRRRQVFLLFALVLSAAGVGLATFPAALDRIETIQEDRGSGRATLWRVAGRVTEDHPLIGVGINGFRSEASRYVREPGQLDNVKLVVETPQLVHNLYLQMLAETGVIGLALFLLIVGSCLRALWLAIATFEHAQASGLATLSRAAFVAIAGMLASSFFLSNGTDRRLWVILALGPALLAVARGIGIRTSGIEVTLRASQPPPRFALPSPSTS